MLVPDSAPPLAIHCSPYGGLGLKTKSFVAARARIDGLLAGAVDVELRELSLTVHEPAGRALVETLVGPLERDTAIRGGGRQPDLAAIVAGSGHAHDEVAGEAWRLFGPPQRASGHQNRGVYAVEWEWLAEGAAHTGAPLAAWSPFVARHDQLMYNDYSTTVGLRGIWEARLRRADGSVIAAPYPRSQVHAHLRGRHASAFLDLVLPHAAATVDFLADYQAINRALGMTVPLGGYKLCAPKKKGAGRVYKRLPPA
jgi:hypothetical protein